jgi:hypothetical protein
MVASLPSQAGMVGSLLDMIKWRSFHECELGTGITDDQKEQLSSAHKYDTLLYLLHRYS